MFVTNYIKVTQRLHNIPKHKFLHLHIQPYIYSIYPWTKSNNLIINSDKTTCSLFSHDPAE